MSQQNKQAKTSEFRSNQAQKHAANLPKTGGLYFQIGLAAVLCIALGVFQVRVQANTFKKSVIELPEELPVHNNKHYVIEQPKLEKTPKVKDEPVKKPVADITKFKKIDNNDKDFIETVLGPEIPENKSIDSISVYEPPTTIDVLPVSLVSDYPVFPGCEKYKSKKRQKSCFTKKITAHVKRTFNADVAEDIGVTGVQKITVTFVIDSNGNITKIKARAPHPDLQQEAIKSIAALPKMSPAKQGLKKVNVSYALPIFIEIE